MPPPSASTLREWRLQPLAERALVAVFSLALVLPGLGTLAGVDRRAPRDERKAGAATARETTPTGAEAQTSSWLAGFEDRFAFRSVLVRGEAAFRYFVLGVSPLPTVVRGRDGWLFYADDDAMVDYVNATPFTARELESWRSTLQHTQDWCDRQGIGYLFVVVPDKHVVYPEYLPASIHPTPGPTRTDQLVEMLRTRSTVHVLDLRGPLLAAKAGARLYHRTDSHWNARGAFVGYTAMMRRLAAAAPRWAAALEPRPLDAFTVRDEVVGGRDLAEMMGLQRWITETRPVFTPAGGWRADVTEPDAPEPQYDQPRVASRVDDPRLPRALVYRDSFGGEVFPFLAEHFSRMLYLWEYDVNPSMVEAEHPDVIVQEWAGRRLHTRLPYDGLPPLAGGRRQQ